MSRVTEAKSVDGRRCAAEVVEVSTGVSLEYVECGEPGGVPLILLHGITDSWRSFAPVLAHLPPSVRAFAVSQRGHGESSRPEHGYGCGDMARDLEAFMDRIGVPAAVVAGHSMGAMVAQRFAVDCPERVKGLVLIGAFATLYRHPAIGEFITGVVQHLSDPVDRSIVEEFQLSTVARPMPERFFDTVVGESLKVPARVWRAAFDALVATPDFSSRLVRVSAPGLLLWGDADAFASRADQEALLDALPDAALLVYRGGGHAVHWESPRRVARDLAAFALHHCSTGES